MSDQQAMKRGGVTGGWLTAIAGIPIAAVIGGLITAGAIKADVEALKKCAEKEVGINQIQQDRIIRLEEKFGFILSDMVELKASQKKTEEILLDIRSIVKSK